MSVDSRMAPEQAAVEHAASRRAVVFDVQRFSVHDGPGIRTVVFFKGCALDCEWCHNPEALRQRPELAYYHERCLDGCNECVSGCPETALRDRRLGRVDFDLCTHCGECVSACPTDALVVIGREVDVAELTDEVLRDLPFFESSGGGVTVSGGEPILHSRFLQGFLEGLHDRGIHTAVETSGACPVDRLERLLPSIDLLLFDLKVMDSDAHRAHTGSDNAGIHAALERLYAAIATRHPNTELEVRMPVVPGINTDGDNVRATAEFLKRLGVFEITLLPYNHFWEAKLPALDTARKPLGIAPPPPEFYERLRQEFRSRGVDARV